MHFFNNIHLDGTTIEISNAKKVIGYYPKDNIQDIIDKNQNENLYFLACCKTADPMTRAKDEDVPVKTYVYFDFDLLKEGVDIEKKAEEIVSKLYGTKFEKWSHLVFSGGGIHLYYVSHPTEINKDNYSKGYELFANEIGKICNCTADIACRNVARIGRLPLSYNNKRERVKTDILMSTGEVSDFLNEMQKTGEVEIQRLEEIQREEQSLRELKQFTELNKKESCFEDIEKIPVEQEVLKDFPQWRFDGKNFWNPDGSRATSSHKHKDANCLVLSDSRWFPFSHKAMGTFLYRREMSKFNNKQTFEYFENAYGLSPKKKELNIAVKTEDTKYTWGLDILNHNFALIKRGNYILITGETGDGKSTFAFFQARKNAEMGNKIVYLSIEMDRDELIADIATRTAGIELKEEYERDIPDWKKMKMENKIREIKNIDNLEIIGMRKGNIVTIEEISKIIIQKKPDIIYIDNFDLITCKETDELKAQRLISMQLMKLSSTFNLPIIVLHHYRKKSAGQKGARSIDDIGGSRKITHDADRIVIMQRNTGQDLTEEEKAEICLTLAKARGGNRAFQKIYFNKGDYKETFTKDTYFNQ